MLRPRRGFTLIELLVVIAIIGVLIALLLPGVQKVREAANRMKCTSNLHNIGLALHNFASNNGRFPPGAVAGPFPPAGVFNNAAHGWVAFLLPYLEQQALYDQYRWDMVAGGVSEWAGARTAQLKILQCPTAQPDRTLDVLDPLEGQWFRNLACTDYAAILGVDPVLAGLGYITPVSNYEGVMRGNFMARIADITDGTSHTAMIAEDAGRPQRWRDGQLVEGSEGCGPWSQYTGCQILVMGSTPPSYTRPGPCAINCTNHREIYSFHPGGANLLFADGSVRFLKADIGIRVLAALATRAGGEVVSDTDF
jgi:prepilin-type N-terminal cleavage/methylation domain-containing protein/prepilin-type processing-associated H-X9-DG protein